MIDTLTSAPAKILAGAGAAAAVSPPVLGANAAETIAHYLAPVIASLLSHGILTLINKLSKSKTNGN